MAEERMERLRRKAAALPAVPGVYLMKNAEGTVIYVGKSRRLCARVSSYFTGNRRTAKTERMVASVSDFDTIVCDTEMEALSLENTLIKRYTPHYNIKLKDAKSYPYIKLTDEPFPRLVVTRQRKKDGRYFGPYPGARDARENAETVSRTFGLVTCRHRFPEETGKVRPCLYRQTQSCAAPCAGDVTEEEYRARVEAAAAVLSGHVRKLTDSLREEMLRLADDEQFEAAARLRDRINALSGLGGRQKVVGIAGEDTDVWGMAVTDVCGALAVLTVRDGALIYKNEFTFPRTEILDEEGAMTFIADYYGEKSVCPPSLTLDFLPEDGDVLLLAEYLSFLRQEKIAVRVPKIGDRSRLCEMAKKNAEEAAAKVSAAAVREDRALCRLSLLLGLETVPDRVEAYDISNFGAEFPTASMVVYENGRLAKNRYRFFRIRDSVQNDYGAMREALTRRLSHRDEEFGTLPDLILLDGGEQHVAVGREVLREAGLDVPLFGMVKDEHHKTRAITDGEREIGIAREQDVYAFVYNLQEEAHRFAVSRMMGAKRKTLKRSRLEDVPGIGKTRAKRLLSHFGSLAAIREAEEGDLLAVPGMTAPAAAAVHAYLHNEEETE